MPAELRTPPAPPSLSYLLGMFAELAAARGSGFSAPAPLGWQDIDAWCRLTQRRLAPWEVQTLRALDAAWLEAWKAGRAEPETATGAAPARRPGR